MKYLILFLLTFSTQLLTSQWNCIGPDGGYSKNLITDGERIYTETNDGVYQSKDNGYTWSLFNKGLPNNYLRKLTLFGNKIIGVNYSNNNNNNIYVHSLNSDSWSFLGAVPENQVTSIAVKNNTIYAATNHGLYLSKDEGKSWALSNSLLDTMTIYQIKVDLEGNIYALTGKGIFITKDETKWTLINSNFYVSATSKLTIYKDAIYINSYASGLIQCSIDKGKSWETLGGNQNFRVVTTLELNDNEIYAGTYEGVYYSNDRGANWKSINEKLEYATASSFLILKDQTLLVSNDRGIFRSSDKGKNWTLSSINLHAFNVEYTSTVDQKLICKMGGKIRHFISANSGITWDDISTKMPDFFGIYNINKRNGQYLMGGNGGLYSIDFDNLKWNSLNTNLGSIIIFDVIIIDNRIFVSSNRGVYSSNDSGITWTKNDNGLIDNYIQSMASDGKNIYIGTASGFYKSSDLGKTWINSTNKLPLYTRQIATLGDRIIAGTDDGIYISDNEGASWQKQNNGISNNSIRDIQTLDSLVFVGTQNGIFISLDRGLSWKDISDGLDHKFVNSITFNNNNIIIGTNGSIWQRPLNQLTSGNKDISTKLGSLKIRSQLILNELHITMPEDQKIIKFIIYNLNGIEVRQIISDISVSEKIIDVSNLVSGKYIIQAISNNFQVVQNTFIKL